MNVALRKPRITREEFFDWAETQDERYEFDGFEPVAMTGGTVNHNRIGLNIHVALRARLRGSGCEALGPDAGVATVGDAVRYPDALVSRAKIRGDARLVQGVLVVFEVMSPTSGHTDCIEKLLEYRAVSSIRRYVIVEYAGIGLNVFERATAEEAWTATALKDGDILRMPEIGIELPVAELYAGVEFSPIGGQHGSANPDTDVLRVGVGGVVRADRDDVQE
jgi:Uma2 family endonuclease